MRHANHDDNHTQQPTEFVEIDQSQILRPERFVIQDRSAITIRAMLNTPKGVTSEVRTYVQWRSGKREVVAPQPHVFLADGSHFLINPDPAEIPRSEGGGWSVKSRQEWLSGAKPPNLATVFKRLRQQFDYYLHLPPYQRNGVCDTLSLWTILTYGYHVFEAVPYLACLGPYASGKTRLLQVLERLCFRPQMASSLTAPLLFRSLHSSGGSVFYDEAERLKEDNMAEVEAIFLGGNKRGMKARRLERDGESFRQVDFDIFGPKALACITVLRDSLSSRCIPIIMMRAPSDAPETTRRLDAPPTPWQQLRDDLHCVAISAIDWLKLPADHSACPNLGARDFELWQPLFALARAVERAGEKGLLKRAQNHAQQLIEEQRNERRPHESVVLFEALGKEIAAGNRPQAKDVLDRARKANKELFQHWTPKRVANFLKGLGITTNWSSGHRVYGKVSMPALRAIAVKHGVELPGPRQPATTTKARKKVKRRKKLR